MPAPLKDRFAFVVGGYSKIGKACIQSLAQAGAHVAWTYHHTREPSLLQSFREKFENLSFCECPLDLGNLNIDQLMHCIEQWSNRKLHILVHNASLFTEHPWGTIQNHHLHQIFQMNTFSPVLITQALHPLLVQNHSHVVFILDVHVFLPLKHRLPYLMTKAALLQATRTLAREMAPLVKVNAIAPGMVSWPPSMSEHARKQYLRPLPIPHLIPPEEIAQTLLFIVQSQHLTGETILLDSGRHLL